MILPSNDSQQQHQIILHYIAQHDPNPVSPQSIHGLSAAWQYMQELIEMDAIKNRGVLDTGQRGRPVRTYTITEVGKRYLDALESKTLFDSTAWLTNWPLATLYMRFNGSPQIIPALLKIILECDPLSDEAATAADALDKLSFGQAHILSKLWDSTAIVPDFNWVDHEAGIEKSDFKAINIRLSPYVYAALCRVDKYLADNDLRNSGSRDTGGITLAIEVALIMAATLIEGL